VNDNKEMAEVLNNYFSSVYTQEDASSIPEPEKIFFLVTTLEFLTHITVDTGTVKKKLEALRPDKASGPDDIPPRLLQELSEELCHPLTVILQKSIDEGVVPDDRKLANVCPIFKKGSRSQAANYRPVSLTSQVCKTIIRAAVVEHLERNCLIKDSQHGFRRGRSCLTNLLEFLDKVTRSVDMSNNVDVVYLDFAKAFDKVPHCRLQKKLEAHMVLEGKY